jgi:hypothetical protein
VNTNYRDALETGAELSDSQKLDLAADIESMLQSTGWDAYLVLLRKMRQETLEFGVQDDTKSRDFYRGKLAAIDEMAELLQAHVVNGYAIREGQERKPKSRTIPSAVPSVFKPGGGGF